MGSLFYDHKYTNKKFNYSRVGIQINNLKIVDIELKQPGVVMSEQIQPDIIPDIRAFVVEKSPLKLKVIDQTLLPKRLEFVEISDTRDGYRVIKDMLVRGAPCIAAVGCLSMIVEFQKSIFDDANQVITWLEAKSEFLISSRPTAVNLKHALDRLVEYARNIEANDVQTLIKELTEFSLKAIEIGRQANEHLGDFGANELLQQASKQELAVLTHCNTGSLATVGHGTALGVIRSLWKKGNLKRAYCTETRPYNQGSRLTAWELVQEKIPTTLVADNMVAYLMANQLIDAVVVGADRVTRNGDTANKIGTLQVAVVAMHYRVPFYVAAPSQSIDLMTSSGLDIKIEERPAKELRSIGDVQLAPDDVDVWNPCFDVTPAHLITGIITEYGVCKTDEIEHFLSTNVKTNEEDALY